MYPFYRNQKIGKVLFSACAMTLCLTLLTSTNMQAQEPASAKNEKLLEDANTIKVDVESEIVPEGAEPRTNACLDLYLDFKNYLDKARVTFSFSWNKSDRSSPDGEPLASSFAEDTGQIVLKPNAFIVHAPDNDGKIKEFEPSQENVGNCEKELADRESSGNFEIYPAPNTELAQNAYKALIKGFNWGIYSGEPRWTLGPPKDITLQDLHGKAPVATSGEQQTDIPASLAEIERNIHELNVDTKIYQEQVKDIQSDLLTFSLFSGIPLAVVAFMLGLILLYDRWQTRKILSSLVTTGGQALELGNMTAKLVQKFDEDMKPLLGLDARLNKLSGVLGSLREKQGPNQIRQPPVSQEQTRGIVENRPGNIPTPQPVPFNDVRQRYNEYALEGRDVTELCERYNLIRCVGIQRDDKAEVYVQSRDKAISNSDLTLWVGQDISGKWFAFPGSDIVKNSADANYVRRNVRPFFVYKTEPNQPFRIMKPCWLTKKKATSFSIWDAGDIRLPL